MFSIQISFFKLIDATEFNCQFCSRDLRMWSPLVEIIDDFDTKIRRCQLSYFCTVLSNQYVIYAIKKCSSQLIAKFRAVTSSIYFAWFNPLYIKNYLCHLLWYLAVSILLFLIMFFTYSTWTAPKKNYLINIYE